MKKQKRLMVAVIAVVMMIAQSMNITRVFADEEEVTIDEGDTAMAISPMRESVVLNPGDEYKSSFSITNPGVAVEDLHYKVEIKPFHVDDNSNIVYEDGGSINQIVNWIKLDSPARGAVPPNESAMVEYTIKVPDSAPAGGQYASITVSTDYESAADMGININEAISVAHLVLAEVTGNTIHSGDILGAGVDSFLLGGKIRAYSTVQNTGNVHALATYTMKIKSVFSGEVLYNNEEDPETHYVLPDKTYYDETIWDKTPVIGIFDVLYTVEFQGLKSEVSRVVVVCPWWALVIVIFALLLLIIRVLMLVKINKKSKKEREDLEIVD